MASKAYAELQSTFGDSITFKLVRLQPIDKQNPPDCMVISSRLAPKKAFKDERESLSELQKTLPDGWTVDRKLKGRYLFMSPRHSGIPNSWKHPNPECKLKYKVKEHSVRDTFEWEAQRYEALICPLETADGEEHITIRGLRSPDFKKYETPIRKSIATFLKNLRRPGQSRTLWIEEICIDPDMTKERVQRLKQEIYSLSEKVIIWLGPEAEDSKHALETLKHFSKQVEYVTSHRWGDAPGAEKPNWWRDDVVPPWTPRDWKSISSLLDREWFKSVWSLQDALSNDQVVLQCGKNTISWVDVRKLLLVLRQKTGLLPDCIRARLFSYARGLMAPPLASCEHLLLWARDQRCPDPHDKVYGILSLLDPRISSRIEVDYSIPIWKTYEQLVLAEMNTYQKLNMLNHCSIATRREGCPS
ncbi:HET-domain-containing protein [Colletotrichum scovillei]|uniref:HET-domain-containing protein n=1 Tax=Colletotrichum scovillei TaxID=1209932 RepID=A0A9P7R5N7_9PEZI|nr:HET-domain-containing protein [Colletotrichum scovillei]KAG7069712.1 HET-domain-containing protein [Colletotrichum scovillei]KAG7073658.1 HET-domain-containing protein [Colletotrichum scovillei]